MMRHRNIDLGPVVVVEPLLSREAFIDERGMLRLDGYFPTRPEQVNFELAFQAVASISTLAPSSTRPAT